MLNLPRLPEFTSERIALMRQDFNRLTPREKQVAQAIMDGITSKEFARRNDISARTVELYRTRIFEKLGVRGATDLVRAIAAIRDDAEHPPVAAVVAAPGEMEIVASAAIPLHSHGGAPMADILTGIGHRRQPEPEAINVFMMWDSAGEAAGYLLVPEAVERDLLDHALPGPGQSRPLTNAISYALFLALRAGLPLYLTGDQQVWDKSWGALPSAQPQMKRALM